MPAHNVGDPFGIELELLSQHLDYFVFSLLHDAPQLGQLDVLSDELCCCDADVVLVAGDEGVYELQDVHVVPVDLEVEVKALRGRGTRRQIGANRYDLLVLGQGIKVEFHGFIRGKG
jgi:hypothetical protein